MKNCLIIQHYESTTAGSTLDWLVDKNIPFNVWRIDLQPEPDLKKYDGLIVCGGKQNVDEEHIYPWLKREKEIVRDWSERGAPVLGLCLGGQLLAEGLGGDVGPHTGWEIGWHQVKVMNETQPLTVFQYHRYRFLPSKKVEIIAEGDYCKFQGIKYKNSLGFQFHPESSKEWIVQCSFSVKESYQGNVQNPEVIRQNLLRQNTLQNWYFSLLNNWVSQRI